MTTIQQILDLARDGYTVTFRPDPFHSGTLLEIKLGEFESSWLIRSEGTDADNAHEGMSIADVTVDRLLDKTQREIAEMLEKSLRRVD